MCNMLLNMYFYLHGIFLIPNPMRDKNASLLVSRTQSVPKYS